MSSGREAPVGLRTANIPDANFDALLDLSAEGAARDVGCSDCLCCLYWEQPDHSQWPTPLGAREDMKKQWFRDVGADFGPCGKLALLSGEPVGYAQFAPPRYLPRIGAYECSRPSDDAIFVSCLYVAPGHQLGSAAGDSEGPARSRAARGGDFRAEEFLEQLQRAA